MLAEVDLDVVSISAPGGLHHEMVLAAAAAGRYILCEKPFAASVDQAREMVMLTNPYNGQRERIRRLWSLNSAEDLATLLSLMADQ